MTAVSFASKLLSASQSLDATGPRLHLEMAPRFTTLARQLEMAMIVVTITSWMLVAWWWQQSLALEAAASQVEAATIRVEAANRKEKEKLTQDGVKATGERVGKMKRHVAFANMLSAKRAFSWSRLLSDLDEAIPTHVSLTTIHMNYKNSTVSLQGGVKSLSDLNALAQSLDRHASFMDATVIDHRVVQTKKRQSASRQPGGIEAQSDASDEHIEFQLMVVYRVSA